MKHATLRGCFTRSIKLFLLFVSLFVFKHEAQATHFRYGSLTWTRGTNDTVIFQISQAWRRSFFGTVNVGGVVNVGTFNFGDASSATLNLTVTTVNLAEDWFFGVATIKKKYTTAGNKTAEFSGCCRLSTLSGGQNDQSYIMKTVVTVGQNNNPPVSGAPPIVNMQTNQTAATYAIPGFDPDGGTITYAITSNANSGINPPAGMSVNPTTGVLTLNTVGKPVNSLWAASITLTDNLGATSNIDFLIKIVAQSTPPTFNYGITPLNNSVISVNPGNPVNFSVQALDSDPGDNVNLVATGLPVGSTLTPSLPASGNPINTNFSFTPTLAQLGSHVISFTATDLNGTQANTNVVINVNTNPVFDVPPTPIANLDYCVSTGTTYTFTAQAHNPDPLVNVQIASVSGITGFSASPALPTAFAPTASSVISWSPTPADWGFKTVSIVANDVNGRSTTHSFNLMVNTTPTITSAAPPTTASVGSLYSYTITATDPDVPFGDVLEYVAVVLPSWITLTDNGDGTAVVTGTPSCADIGSYSFHVELEDVFHHCGNHVDLDFDIDVEDNTAPSITCPASIVQNTDAGLCSAVVSYTASAIDLCSAANLAYSTPSGSVFPVGSSVVTVTAIDAAGNESSCSFQVDVEDHEAPSAVCNNLSLNLDANGQASLSAALVDNGSTDACGISSVMINKTSFDCSNLGSNLVELSVVDLHNNTSSCLSTVTIQDQIAPTVICPAAIVQNTDAGQCSASVTYNASAIDICGTASLTYSSASGSIFPVGSSIVTVTASDASGNSASCVFQVDVEDHEAPGANCANVSVDLDVNGLATITAALVNNASTDACGVSSVSLDNSSFDCSNVGSNSVVLTVVDVHGNSASCTAIVTVNDVEDPTAVCNNVSTTISNGTASVNAVDVAAGSFDACGIASYSLSQNSFGCADVGANNIVLTVTDNSGNSSTCTATVTVIGQFPDVSISETVLPEFCNGQYKVLTAESEDAVSYLWNNGSTNSSIQATSSGNYSVVITDAYGCTNSASVAVSVNPYTLSSSYVIISKEEAKIQNNSYVMNGGVGVTKAGKSAKILSSSTVSAAGTFVRAPQIVVSGNSTVTTSSIGQAVVSLPAFLPNNNNVNSTTNIPSNANVTLNGTNYGKINIGNNATVTFAQANVYIRELKSGDNVKIKFNACANLHIRNDFELGDFNKFNVTGSNRVNIYVGVQSNSGNCGSHNGNGDVEIGKGDSVFANIYAPYGEIEVEGQGGSNNCNNNNNNYRSVLKGQFIAEEFEAKYTSIYWNNNCIECPGLKENKDEAEVLLSAQNIQTSVFPNPSTSHFILKVSGTEQANFNYELLDISGRIVEQMQNLPLNNDYKIGEHLMSGSYILKVISGNEQTVSKLIKQN